MLLSCPFVLSLIFGLSPPKKVLCTSAATAVFCCRRLTAKTEEGPSLANSIHHTKRQTMAQESFIIILQRYAPTYNELFLPYTHSRNPILLTTIAQTPRPLLPDAT